MLHIPVMMITKLQISGNKILVIAISVVKKGKEICNIADRSLVIGCRSSWTWACPAACTRP